MIALRVSDARAAEIASREKAATRDATLVRYDHGGGRFFRDGESGQRVLVADFYNEGDREFYTAARDDIPDLLADRAELIAAAREAAEALVGARDRLLAAGGYTALPDRDAVSLALARLAALGIVPGGSDGR